MAEVEGSAEIQIDADLTPFERALAEVLAASRRAADSVPPVRFRIDVEELRSRLAAGAREAARQAEAATPPVEVETDVDASALTDQVRDAARIAEAAAPTIEIETDVDNDRIARAAGLLSSVGSTAGGLASAGASAATIGTALGAAVPLAAGLAAALVNIAPAAAVGATAILALGSAAGAARVGTLGVGDAITAAFAPAAPAAGRAAGASNAYANAQRAVKDAVQAAGLANERAARQIEDAERALSDAQKEALRAQDDLNDARRQAARDLEDLNSRLAGAQLDQRGAVLDLRQAEQDLADVRAQGGKASAQQLAEAQLAYDRAVQRLKDQQVETRRLGADTVEANKAGVEGSDTVRTAQDRVSASQRAVGDAVRALRDAQVEAARTAAQGLENVRRAQEALTQSVGGSAGGVDKLALALAQLSPNARAFVRELIALKGAFRGVQLDVQDALFKDLAADLRITAESLLPTLRKGLVDSASSLNLMAREAAASARELADNGTLGKALDSANQGLRNLAGIPGIVVTALGQLAAAAGPLFERLTQAAANGAKAIGDSLDEAFRSGRLEGAINDAVQLIGELGSIAGDVIGIIRSVFDAADAETGSFLVTTKEITQSLRDAFASPEVQEGLRALFSAASLAAKTIGGLLVDALKIVGPVLAALGPSVEALVTALGDALRPVIQELGPVLATAADAVGALVMAWIPLIEVAGQLITDLLPALVPWFETYADVLRQVAPLVSQLAGVLLQALAPILGRLPEIMAPLLDAFTILVSAIVPVAIDLLEALSPSLVQIAVSMAEILVALTPLIELFALFIAQVLRVVGPAVVVFGQLVGRLAAIFSRELAATINSIVVPAIRVIASLLRGDFSGALESAGRVARGIADTIRRRFGELPGQIGSALRDFGRTVSDRLQPALRAVRELPGKARDALGDLSRTLYRAGRSLIQGFIDGIESLGGSLTDKVSGILGDVKDFFGNSPAKVGPFSGRGWTLHSGEALVRDFSQGIDDSRQEAVRAAGGLMTRTSAALASAPLEAVGGAPVRFTGLTGTAAPVNVTLVNEGVIGSRNEVLDWLSTSLETLRRQGRLSSLTAA